MPARTLRTALLVLVAALLVGVAPKPALARSLGAPAGTTVIVIPALYRVVQIAFDVEQFRDAILVSYQQAAGTDEVYFHGWDGSSWQDIDPELYRSGGFTALPIVHVVIVGEPGIPEVVFDATGWAPKVHHIKSYSLSDQVNGYSKALGLSAQQIRWFAKRYDMQVEDLNWERRRYGRYGPPGGRTYTAPPARRVSNIDPDPSLGDSEARDLRAGGDIEPIVPEKGLRPPVERTDPVPVVPVMPVTPPRNTSPPPVVEKGEAVREVQPEPVSIENSPMLVPEEK